VLQAREIAGYDVALDSLISQLSRQDRPASLQAANRLSRAIVGIMANYDVTVPVQVGYLDVAGRDVIYAAEAGRWQDASAAAAELRANYAGVGTHVAGKDSTLDRRVRQQFSQLEGSVGGGRVPCASARLPPPCSTTWISVEREPTDQSSHMNTRRWSALASCCVRSSSPPSTSTSSTIAIPSIQRGLGTKLQ